MVACSMALRLALAVCAFIAVSWAQYAARATCDLSWQWQCDSGQCISSQLICDGIIDCKDGSDENSTKCDAIPSFDLAENQQVQIKVQLNAGTWVEFQLCGTESCSMVVVAGSNPSATLWYYPYTSCNARGGWRSCSRGKDVVPAGWTDFPSGEFVFVAERRPHQLSVFLRGHTEGGGVVAASQELTLIRVRPWMFTYDMPVYFGEITTTAEPRSTDASLAPSTPHSAPTTMATASTSPSGGKGGAPRTNTAISIIIGCTMITIVAHVSP